MKNIVKIFAVLSIGGLSLQSCVSNYTLADYKTPAAVEVHTKKVLATDTQDLVAELSANTTKAKIAAQDTEIGEVARAAMAMDATVSQILDQAHSWLGTRYRLGGQSRAGIDCSAFVMASFSGISDINLPRVAEAQSQLGERVSRDEVKPGDLVFFQTRGSRISHVGIVESIGEDGEIKFIHASSSKGVTISSLNEKYWAKKFRFAKRILTASIAEANQNLVYNK